MEKEDLKYLALKILRNTRNLKKKMGRVIPVCIEKSRNRYWLIIIGHGIIRNEELLNNWLITATYQRKKRQVPKLPENSPNLPI